MDLGAKLAGKRVLVTGASSGLGENFARVAASCKAKVVIGARRKDRLQSLAAELQTLAGVLQQTAAQLREQSEQAHRDLRDQLQNQAVSLTGEFTQQHATLSATLDQAVQQLSLQKTDRSSLATLFQELSQRLSHDQPPQQA